MQLDRPGSTASRLAGRGGRDGNTFRFLRRPMQRKWEGTGRASDAGRGLRIALIREAKRLAASAGKSSGKCDPAVIQRPLWKAVSYTHLDVYKRQNRIARISAGIMILFGFCVFAGEHRNQRKCRHTHHKTRNDSNELEDLLRMLDGDLNHAGRCLLYTSWLA